MLPCTYAEARKARGVHRRNDVGGWTAKREQLEAGWTFIGSGHSRHAYLAPSGVVYKVGWTGSNKAEHEAATIMRSANHPFIGVPETRYYDTLGVLAMQYIEGTPGIPDDGRRKFEAAIKKFGCIDWWYLNFIYDGTKLWMIDLGEFADGSMSGLAEQVAKIK